MVLAAVFTAFAVVALPALVMMAIWATVTALRILRPEQPLPLFADPVARRREATEAGVAVPVGFREIREDLCTHAQRLTLPYRYQAAVGGTHHVPEPWIEDLYQRRN